MGLTRIQLDKLIRERLFYLQGVYEHASVFYPNAKQKEVLACKAKRIIIIGGRKCGKTSTEVYRIINDHDKVGEVSVVYTLTYQMLRDIWIKEFEKQRTPNMKIIKSTGLIRLENGGEVWLRHGQNHDSATLARGISAATHFVFDEHAWNAPDLWDTVMPNTFTKNASVVFISSPWVGHLYDLYCTAVGIEEREKDLQEEDKTWRTFRRNSYDGTPNGKTDEEWRSVIEKEMMTLSPSVWECEIEGKFPEATGECFTNIKLAWDSGHDLPERPDKTVIVATGIDVARKNDKTAIVAVDSQFNVWALMCDNTAGRFGEWGAIAENAAMILHELNMTIPAWFDNTGIGDGIRSEFAIRQVNLRPVIFNAVEENQQFNNKLRMVTNLQLAFMHEKIHIANTPLGEILKRQLLTYTYELNEATRYIKYSKPNGGEDDLVDALLLAYTNALENLNRPAYRPLTSIIESGSSMSSGIFGK